MSYRISITVLAFLGLCHVCGCSSSNQHDKVKAMLAAKEARIVEFENLQK